MSTTATLKYSLLLTGLLTGLAAATLTAQRAAVRIGPAIADRYLAFDDSARDKPLSEADAARQRKWRRAMIRQQIRNELQISNAKHTMTR
ncbi:hypothetical protein M409DRAFT_29871 [Zasmidium cellare ATCC 36951]|uniref:HIG1 domain-containing protein n=1 Tax=Zasmidium cellare ATCC 36951 TaxID=1080233 RepID=A0A6A6BY47_ZASCE|nr:uncharacterized protein M409DRAFT_29871 [Zasmidium cellare ATCC 36951]KAF2159711.1 hypothetical protein M409DRAFT_29871 [Zasmidium cellare ATCC 36951]